MELWVHTLVTILGSVVASSGFWAFLQYQDSKKETVQKALAKQQKAMIDVLIGLGHDKIMYLGMKYIERKWISHSEYENLYQYIFLPYKALGGNGSADNVMQQVNKLELRDNVHFERKDKNE